MCDLGLTFLLVTLSGITSTLKHQCHNLTEIYFSLTVYTLAYVSRALQKGEGIQGGDKIIERFLGNLAKIPLGNY